MARQRRSMKERGKSKATSKVLQTGAGKNLQRFADSLKANFASNITAQPEDQLKAPLQNYLQEAARLSNVSATSRTEATAPDISGRPDIGVSVNGLLCGFIELKAPGRGAKAERYKGHDLAQWHRFKEMPNLVYSDGAEWGLYRQGSLIEFVKIPGSITSDGGACINDSVGEALQLLFRKFFAWQPIVPKSPEELASMLAPLCRLLRDDVAEATKVTGSALNQLAKDWRAFLFPDADDNQFADAYAQTVTYALLLSRFSGNATVTTDQAVSTLSRGHYLLSQALRILADSQARRQIETAIDLLERAIAAIDVKALLKHTTDPWLYFYEDFLAQYDPELRKDRGVYYTPKEVVSAQVELVAKLLEHRFSKPLAYADQDVVFLDPATGTGAYPLAAIAYGLDRTKKRSGAGALAGSACSLAQTIHGFEILIGPYAVSHLRVTEAILAAGGGLPPDGAHVYLTDTLESPFANPKGQLTLLHKPLADEHKRARLVKESVRVLVCMGNPPYDRQEIDTDDTATARKGGWIRTADDGKPGILEDFLAPVRNAGAGVHLKNVYNDYVYFWRWCLWKVFDSCRGPGIVSLITASSYLRGPGFMGMREYMRRVFDEYWIVDLEGDNRGPRKTENVFAIQTPVAILIGVRVGDAKPTVPAEGHYTRVVGTRDQKLQELSKVREFKDFAWQSCQSSWMAPLLPQGLGNFFDWPLLTDIFPWQQPGIKVGRTWPIAPLPEILSKRWEALCHAPADDRPALFKESPTGRSASWRKKKNPQLSIRSMPKNEALPSCERYAFRSFDRQWLLSDLRLLDRESPSLWITKSQKQIFMTSLLTTVLGAGPSAVITPYVPDLHHFRGSFGGKDVIPLWRDAAGHEINLTSGLMAVLNARFSGSLAPEDLFFYTYGVLANPRYSQRFSEELAISPPRLPITKNKASFDKLVSLGRKLVWLHSFGSRCVPSEQVPNTVPQGRARCIRAISGKPEEYPDSFSFDAATQTLTVGTGAFAPVSPDVWGFDVSGFLPLEAWLSFRMKSGAGRSSSALDDIGPSQWTNQLTVEFLEIVWVLEQSLELYGDLDKTLDEILGGELMGATELPNPQEAERRAPEESADVSLQIELELL
jgi:hypothetical protein